MCELVMSAKNAGMGRGSRLCEFTWRQRGECGAWGGLGGKDGMGRIVVGDIQLDGGGERTSHRVTKNLAFV